MNKRVLSTSITSPNKKLRTSQKNKYFHALLEASGLILKLPPNKCVLSDEIVNVIRNIKKNLQKHFDYPRNVSELFSDLEKECQNLENFKHFLFPNVSKIVPEDELQERFINDSLFKILLSVPILQNKLTDLIFEKAIDLASETQCAPYIQMILKSFSSLDSIVSPDKIATHLINLLDIATEKMVLLEIITSMPDIIGDQEHNNIANELSRILNEDPSLTPAILDCLSYLSLSDDQYEQLQIKTLNILTTLVKCEYYPNFVKFLLIPGRLNDLAYFEAVKGIRNSLAWPTSSLCHQELATSQVLTTTAIRNSIISSKVIANSWLKIISQSKVDSDCKPFDFIIMLILYSISEEKQKSIEILIKKHVKLEILKKELLEECFEKFGPILKDNLKNLICLSNSLLKNRSDALVETFGLKLYSLMFSHLDDCCPTIVAELLQLGLDCQQAVTSILIVLNEVASESIDILKPQCVQMLTLLDRLDNMSLVEIRAVMNLLSALAYSYENSVIRDDIHMIIRKELGNSTPKIKIQGILAGLYAVKYLMVKDIDSEETLDFPDDVSYSSVTLLSAGDVREAAQIIELISPSTRQFPDLIAFFYDELAHIIDTTKNINKNFLSWLTDAVTNDLQQNFIVDSIENNKIGDITLSMQYCLNTDSEMDEAIAINIAGLTLNPKTTINIAILPALFQLVQTLHCKQHNGTLSSIDALLGCPVIMPKFDINLIEDMESCSVSKILDCSIYCVNWFRELLNAFAGQNDDALQTKILQRLLQIEQLESIISQMMIKINVPYKPPICLVNITKYINNHNEQKTPKMGSMSNTKIIGKSLNEDVLLPDTVRTQTTQNKATFKHKLNIINTIPLRQFNMNILHLINNDMGTNTDECILTIKSLNFLLKCTIVQLSNVLISKFRRNTFLSKHDTIVYDHRKAQDCATKLNVVLPKLIDHFISITEYLENHSSSQNDSNMIFTPEFIDYLSCLESIYIILTIYFKWIKYRNNSNVSFLKNSLQIIASKCDHNNEKSLKDLVLLLSKYLQKQTEICFDINVAISLIELVKTLQEFSNNKIILKVLQEMAHNFIMQQWKTSDGVPEKGFAFNQNLDKLAHIYFMSSELLNLKNLTVQLTNDIKNLKTAKDFLPTLKSVNRGNFAIIYKNLGTAVYESTKDRLNKRLTNSELLKLWKDVAIILKNMSDLAKSLDSRNNLAVFFKKAVPILKLFISNGIPIFEIELKKETEEVLDILKILQQSTRFLQSLCCHSRLKKDKVLMSKVPNIRQLLETLIYKVKALLAANNCSQAFWMGNLKNKNIYGELIATQQSIESEESTEDCDDQLPNDDSESDDDVINPDSKSISDIV